jgi:hypothetical protein
MSEPKERCEYFYQDPQESRPDTCHKPKRCKICGYCENHCLTHRGVKEQLVRQNQVSPR